MFETEKIFSQLNRVLSDKGIINIKLFAFVWTILLANKVIGDSGFTAKIKEFIADYPDESAEFLETLSENPAATRLVVSSLVLANGFGNYLISNKVNQGFWLLSMNILMTAWAKAEGLHGKDFKLMQVGKLLMRLVCIGLTVDATVKAYHSLSAQFTSGVGAISQKLLSYTQCPARLHPVIEPTHSADIKNSTGPTFRNKS
jgi:hypothetical protein